jgi:hypothetical protein
MEVEFKSFDKILHIGKLYMSITQKLHGSNAQIYIYKDENDELQLKAGSRSRWLHEGDDNYNFARFCNENREELLRTLGEGRHFGEWCGPGINSGEGLKEKTLCLFNWRRWIGKDLPDKVTVVPILYKGRISLDVINETMEKLKREGSMLCPGFMKPEGIVIELDGQFYKNVFDQEEVKWNEKIKMLSSKESVDISYLLQPLRLEKLLSKDEKYIREYPNSLGRICSDYVIDLEEEKQFKSANEDEFKAEKKALGKQIFYFVKSIMSAMR